MSEREQNISEIRNSPFRKVQSITTGPIVHLLDRFGVTADDVTEFGELGTKIGSQIATERDPDSPEDYKLRSFLSLFILAFSQISDMVDGPLARKQATAGTAKGEEKDSMTDRKNARTMALARMVSAQIRGDGLGVVAAGANALTSAFSAGARAFAESRGVVVAENGRGIITKLGGTHVPRSIIGTFVTAFPVVKKFPLQTIADSVGAVSNVATALERVSDTRNGVATLSEEKRLNASRRLLAITGFQLETIAKVLSAGNKK